MILSADFAASKYARDSEFTTNIKDKPLIVQFAAKNSKELSDAAELVAKYVGGIGKRANKERDARLYQCNS